MSFKNVLSFFLFVLITYFGGGAILNAVCYKCEEVREKNANLPPLKYEYYDDYIEARKAEGKPIPGDINFEDDNADRLTEINKK